MDIIYMSIRRPAGGNGLKGVNLVKGVDGLNRCLVRIVILANYKFNFIREHDNLV